MSVEKKTFKNILKYVQLRERLKNNTEKIILIYLFVYNRIYLTFKNIYTNNELYRLFLMKHTHTRTHIHTLYSLKKSLHN